MNELAKKYRDAANLLNTEADHLDPPAAAPNAFAGAVMPYPPVPEQFKNPSDPYGARADIGSPGLQCSLRAYAFRDGKTDVNQYVKDRGLTCIWPDVIQPEEKY